MLEAEKIYQCSNQRCAQRVVVKADFEQGNVMDLPTSCPQAPRCKSKSLIPVENSQVCQDYQEITIQEQVKRLGLGSIPRSIVVVLENDLVDQCKPGDDVIVVGRVCQRWRSLYRNERCELELVLRANSVVVHSRAKTGIGSYSEDDIVFFREYWERNKEKPLSARNHILSSVCSQLYGLFPVKLGLVLTLLGGAPHVDPSGTRTRGESHMLLVGDPGTGKSQFLREAAKLSSRSVLTTGIGTTSAGLTAAAVKDGAEWMLEGGALVLADRGVCCIDEFSCIRSHDRTTIHEAMEQQTISVAKAGMICKLSTRATVIAATNAKGRYDMSEDATVNTGIASPLLSRFDLVLLLLDTANAEFDMQVSSHILRNVCDTNLFTQGSLGLERQWSLRDLQAYFTYVKHNLNPTLNSHSQAVLARYYQNQRRTDERFSGQARTTLRLLESLVRLAQAHARLLMREDVIVQDAVVACSLMESSITSTCIFGTDSIVQGKFPDNAETHYTNLQQTVLTALGLGYMLRSTPRAISNDAIAETPDSQITQRDVQVVLSPGHWSNVRKSSQTSVLNDSRQLEQNSVVSQNLSVSLQDSCNSPASSFVCSQMVEERDLNGGQSKTSCRSEIYDETNSVSNIRKQVDQAFQSSEASQRSPSPLRKRRRVSEDHEMYSQESTSDVIGDLDFDDLSGVRPRNS